MSQKTKRCAAFLGTIGLTVALLCFTVMLSGNHCPAFEVYDQTAKKDFSHCHQTEKTNDTLPTCSSCNLLFSPESVHPKTPELDRNYFSILTVFHDTFHFAPGILFFPRNAKDRNPNFNVHKFVVLSISSVRLLI
ncbi:hypothetical protein [Leptospira alstonii]|uniref:Uncharacterized protein n=2 Tax=Leptospira alstonii TaxID=28452 RepID=M6CRY4_9LEPT|nr:hypothetical protein [Leptospira alstonii]EMJ93301.1 hypothetical protein LEP1GSC194_1535 [Leptospira alstonii serovar Sichuan str. 79601]EQA82174.1 hypothetical protein LEP1GSC193_0693 [Leptospira alstonii serovar Pingchang str. 80-412]